jgi:hypothetical protein
MVDMKAHQAKTHQLLLDAKKRKQMNEETGSRNDA